MAVSKAAPEPGVVVSQVAAPKLDGGGVLLEMAYAGICGSDVATYRWQGHRQHLASRLPVVLGHEGVGRVLDSGGAEGLAPGTRVVPEPVVWCWTCAQCRRGRTNLCVRAARLGTDLPGTMAQRLVVPAATCYRVPDRLSDEQGALLETMAVAVHAARRVGDLAGKRCVVVGPGAVGLCLVQTLNAMGAGSVTVVGRGSSTARLEVARTLGATDVVVAQDDDDLPAGALASFEVAFEAAGSPQALVTAAQLAEPGGTVVALGSYQEAVAFDYRKLLRYREVDLLASRARVATDWAVMLALIEGGKLTPGPMPMPVVPISNGVDAFAIAAENSAVKVLLDCQATS